MKSFFLSTLSKKDKEHLSLLSIGTLLEYADVMLYLHMAIIIDKVFFSPDMKTSWFLSHMTFCSAFLFRPIGAIFLGWIGDTLGRRITIFITTTFTAIGCLVTAVLPGYATLGLLSAYTLTLCRMLQGITSMGEIQGAKLYMMESVKDVRTQCFCSAIFGLFSDIGTFFSISISAFACYLMLYHKEAWRIAFLLGGAVALIGLYARKYLRETREFTDAKMKLLKVTNNNLKALEHPLVKIPVNRAALFFFIMSKAGDMCSLCFIPFYYCKECLEQIGMSNIEIITQNQLVTLVVMCATLTCALLVYAIEPLKIAIFRNWVAVIFIISAPILLSLDTPSKYLIFGVQCCSMIFTPNESPAAPIFFKQFPIFKRSRCIFIGFSIGSAIASLLFVFPLEILKTYFGHYTLYIVPLPLIVISLIGKYYFKSLVEEPRTLSQ
ncbi:MFS transporter [Candidatus Sneabacter namystus]|uniref:MFS transporter n=1 Tax=Candidatus Sneabacter namystus TaxID=2601646 RepID=A0A5C0UKP5_9RICK|nr:MFS transporter [Candidatus Sneabacter namystus]QEK39424.1 MFS transporter [Candidatus Sneabacter namystus]